MNSIRMPIFGVLLFFSQALFAANIVIEDFSSTPINPILLGAVDSQINAGQYRMEVTQAGIGKTTERVHINKQGVTFLSAKVTLSSASDATGSPTPAFRGRITNYLGNVNYNSGDPLIDGVKGNIWTQLAIERLSNGSFRAFAYAERVTDSTHTNQNPADSLFFQTLSPTPTASYNQQFELAIEIVGSIVNYKINGNTEFSFDLTDIVSYSALTGNIYPPTNFSSGLALPQLNARVQDGPGTAVVLFDDITTNSLQAAPSANSIPTLSQWGLFALISLLLIASGFRRKTNN